MFRKIFHKCTNVKYSTLVIISLVFLVAVYLATDLGKKTPDENIKTGCQAVIVIAGLVTTFIMFVVFIKFQQGDGFFDE